MTAEVALRHVPGLSHSPKECYDRGGGTEAYVRCKSFPGGLGRPRNGRFESLGEWLDR